jgi:hypothetical protein
MLIEQKIKLFNGDIRSLVTSMWSISGDLQGENYKIKDSDYDKLVELASRQQKFREISLDELMGFKNYHNNSARKVIWVDHRPSNHGNT